MIVQPAIACESESEETGHEVFIFRKSDHAVTDVARRQHTQFFAKPSGASSVIGHGNDYGQVRPTLLQSAQKRGEPCAPANGNDSGLVGFHFSEAVTSCLKSASWWSLSKSLSRIAKKRFAGLY